MEELNYDTMLATIKKYCDMLPGLVPENKHEMEALCTPDCVFSYPDGMTEADHVAVHWEIYRAHLYYEPHPLYIHIDERLKTADCVLLEEAKHPVTGELVKDAFDKYIPGLNGSALMHELFEFTLHEGKVKIKNIFMGFGDIDPNSEAWRRWRDLSKPNK
jgi:hypothetical protein